MPHLLVAEVGVCRLRLQRPRGGEGPHALRLGVGRFGESSRREEIELAGGGACGGCGSRSAQRPAVALSRRPGRSLLAAWQRLSAAALSSAGGRWQQGVHLVCAAWPARDRRCAAARLRGPRCPPVLHDAITALTGWAAGQPLCGGRRGSLPDVSRCRLRWAPLSGLIRCTTTYTCVICHFVDFWLVDVPSRAAGRLQHATTPHGLSWRRAYTHLPPPWRPRGPQEPPSLCLGVTIQANGAGRVHAIGSAGDGWGKPRCVEAGFGCILVISGNEHMRRGGLSLCCWQVAGRSQKWDTQPLLPLRPPREPTPAVG